MRLLENLSELPADLRGHEDVATPELGPDAGVRVWGVSAAERLRLAALPEPAAGEPDLRTCAWVAATAGTPSGGLLFTDAAAVAELACPGAFELIKRLADAAMRVNGLGQAAQEAAAGES
jgi:hypothetical protein